jgi:hypothetical protein
MNYSVTLYSTRKQRIFFILLGIEWDKYLRQKEVSRKMLPTSCIALRKPCPCLAGILSTSDSRHNAARADMQNAYIFLQIDPTPEDI